MKRLMIILITLAVFAGILTQGIFVALAQEKATDLEELVYADYPMTNIGYEYRSTGVSKGTTESASVFYSHGLLTQPSNQLNKELAKVSVALAMAAYNESHIDSLLGEMGFDIYEENSPVYNRSASQLTYEDNDYVAYTIGQKEWTNPETNEVYVFYCVPVKGTTKNAEWFSNFNLGKADEHEGFRKASLEVYDKLQSCFKADRAKDKDHRFVLLTGHSRGAACANLISGWLSADDAVYTSMEHVFGYTFACPAVSMKADTTLTNIYNFNNPGDMITMLPMEDWGYDRYGQDKELYTTEMQLDNFEQQFNSITEDTYVASLTGVEYRTILRNLLGEDVNVYHDTASLQLLLDVAAWGLGGQEDVPEIGDVLKAHLGGKENIDNLLKVIYEACSGMSNIIQINNELKKESADSDILAGYAYRAYEQTLNMTDEEFATYLSDNSTMVNDLEKESDIEIEMPEDFLVIYGMLNTSKYDLLEVTEIMVAANDLFFDENGDVLEKISHGHAQATYVTWINSMYYGYSGWANNTSVTEVNVDDSYKSVGDFCFSNCGSLEMVNIIGSGVSIGEESFSYCKNLAEAILPDSTKIGDEYAGWGAFNGNDTKLTITCDIGSIPYGYLESDKGNGVTSVVISEGIKTIGDNAFDNCQEMKSITIPEGISSIGSAAFWNCDGITQLTIPDTVISIGKSALGNCDGLKSITIPVDYDTSNDPFYMNPWFEPTTKVTSIRYTYGQTGVMPNNRGWNEMSLEYISKETLVKVEFEEGITHIGNEAFMMCENLTEVSFSKGLKSIGEQAFSECFGLTELSFPAGLESIGREAFFWCDGLTEVLFSEGLKNIDVDAFYACIGLTELSFPEGLEYIGRGAFDGCVGLTEVSFSKGLKSLGSCAFRWCEGLTEIVLPDGLIEIQQGTFRGCTNLTEIEFPESLTSIGDYAFNDCVGLTEIKLPNSLRYLGEFVFDGCTSVKKVTVPIDCEKISNLFGGYISSNVWRSCLTTVETVYFTYGQTGVMTDSLQRDCKAKVVEFEDGITYICDYAFSYCTKLTEVILPEGLTSIGDYAFGDCIGIEEITIPNSVRTLGEFVFDGCTSLKKVTMPVDCEDTCNLFGGYTESSSGGDKWKSCDTAIESIYFTYGQTGVMKDYEKYKSNRSLKTIELEEGITYIGKNAFSYYESLESVILPSTLERIGRVAFGDCTELTEIVLPEGLISIDNHAFSNCIGLTEIVLPEGLTSIDVYAFNNCTGLTEIIFEGDAPSFGSYCFEDVTATAYYPEGNSTWTDEVMQDYGGTITWVEGKPGHSGVMGDMDNDGDVTAYDALMLKKFFVGMISFEAEYEQYADLNADGVINAKDLLILKKLLAA